MKQVRDSMRKYHHYNFVQDFHPEFSWNTVENVSMNIGSSMEEEGIFKVVLVLIRNDIRLLKLLT